MADVIQAVLGLGWLTTAVTLYRAQSDQRQKVMEFLMQQRHELDKNPRLLCIVGLLQNELDRRLKNEDPPSLPDDMNTPRLRDLAGFLERIGTYLGYNPATFRQAYGFFSEEVLLCANSDIMWADGDDYRTSVYWRSFAKFVTATHDNLRERKIDMLLTFCKGVFTVEAQTSDVRTGKA